jgi:hypothetical protein
MLVAYFGIVRSTCLGRLDLETISSPSLSNSSVRLEGRLRKAYFNGEIKTLDPAKNAYAKKLCMAVRKILKDQR